MSVRRFKTIVLGVTPHIVVVTHNERSRHWHRINGYIRVNVGRMQLLNAVYRWLPVINESASLQNSQLLSSFPKQHILRQSSGHGSNRVCIANIPNHLSQWNSLRINNGVAIFSKKIVQGFKSKIYLFVSRQHAAAHIHFFRSVPPPWTFAATVSNMRKYFGEYAPHLRKAISGTITSRYVMGLLMNSSLSQIPRRLKNSL